MGTDCRILANGQLIGNGPFPITGTNSIAYNLLVAEDKRKEVKFDLTTEGKGHISLDVAIVNARRLVRQDEQRYLNRLGWEEIVWSTSESDAGCASIKVILQFRRPGRGLPEEESGLEEFLFNYNGELQDRQVLAWPSNSSAPTVTELVPTPLPTPAPTTSLVPVPTPDAMFVSQWGTWGTGYGEFRNPAGVAVASDGSVYVTDWLNNRIQKFTSEGVFVNRLGSYGRGDGDLRDPAGVAVASDGSVYVTDWSNNRTQKFSPRP